MRTGRNCTDLAKLTCVKEPTATLLLAAHDIGGGHVLVPILEACRGPAYDVVVLASGPARTLFLDDARCADNSDVAQILSEFMPNIVVTGTSAVATLESELWEAARIAAIPSVAVLDTTINLEMRFAYSQPDVICAVDETSRRELEAATWCTARVEVVGQSHLERTHQLSRLRRPSGGRSGRLVFFSEPIAASPGGVHAVGYEQFSVLARLLPGLAAVGGLSLTIKPHPNETIHQWNEWLSDLEPHRGVRAGLDTADAFTLMMDADGVLGMASMALVEAAISGVPVLALQPGRRYCPNPMVDAQSGIRLVTDPDAVVDATRAFGESVTGLSGASTVSNSFDGSMERTLRVIAGVAAERGR